MKLKHILFSLAFLTIGSLSSQDFHNSYWQFAPNIISPTFTGAFYGNIRVSAIGRNQARPIVKDQVDSQGEPLFTNQTGNEFNDLSLGLDGNIPFGFTKGDWVSAGMNISRSKVGATNFTRTYTGLSVAYHLSLDKNQTRIFTVGLKYGSYGTNFNIGSDDLDNIQTPRFLVNGADDELEDFLGDNMSSGNGSNNSLSVNDWMLGFMFTTPVGDDADLRIGIASDHLLAPRLQSSANGMAPIDPMDPNPPVTVQSRKNLDRRFNAFAQYYVSINDNMVWNPTLLYQSTANANQILLQSIFSFLVNAEKEFTFNAGLGIRLNSSMDIPIYLGADYKDWRFGLSYDTNVTGLTQANSTFGALEIGASKLINWNKKAVVKPKFVCPRL